MKLITYITLAILVTCIEPVENFNGTPIENYYELQALLNVGGNITITKDTVEIETFKGVDSINALVISKATNLTFNNIKLIGQENTSFHLFSVERGNFDVTIDGNCIAPLDANPSQPDASHAFPNIIDLWTYNSVISGNGETRTITLKNSTSDNYWCNIIKSTGGGYENNHTIINLENIDHVTRGGGVTVFSGGTPYVDLNMTNVKIKTIIKGGQIHYGHSGYVHEIVNTNFNDVEIDGCHFDLRSTERQDFNTIHYFDNLNMINGSMLIKNGGSSTTYSLSIFQNSTVTGAFYGKLSLKNTTINGGVYKGFKTLGGNLLNIAGNDFETDVIDLRLDTVKMKSYYFMNVGANVTIDVSAESKAPKVPNGTLTIIQ